MIKEPTDSEPKTAIVSIAVNAFGVKHAETPMRDGEWAEAAELSGMEYAGEVVRARGREFQLGDKVAALMGAMGRNVQWQLPELTLVRAS